jgi:hypothetical protein
MAHVMTRRQFAIAASAASFAGGPAQGADLKTLRFIMRNDLRVLDPIWTTAYASRNHGYMVFDTLFALDSKFKPHPQMVGDYSIAPDKLTYSFTLRDGLVFHDGQPVRGTDCVASLRRWMARDTLGQALAKAIDRMTGADDKNFTIPVEGTLSTVAHGPRQGVEPVAVHHARAARQHRSISTGHRDGRVRPVQVCHRRVPTGTQDGLCQERRLRAARRTAELGVGRQGGQARPVAIWVASTD